MLLKAPKLPAAFMFVAAALICLTVATTNTPAHAATRSPNRLYVSMQLPRSYHIQHGDTLRKIAQSVYGQPKYWWALYQKNRDRLTSPDSIKVGHWLRIPSRPWKYGKPPVSTHPMINVDAAPMPAGSVEAYAAALTGNQFGCLNDIIQRESGWNPRAFNPGSGAYGIPQALPGSKMAVAGADWQTNPRTQIRWMVKFYIPSVYGTPCAAWGHEQESGWY